jgi:hypothetical protein
MYAAPPGEVNADVATTSAHQFFGALPTPVPSAAAASMLAVNSDAAVQAAVESLPAAGTHNPGLMRLWELLASHPTPLTTRAELQETLDLLRTELPLAEREYIVLLLNGGARRTPFKPSFMDFAGLHAGKIVNADTSCDSGCRQLLKQPGCWDNRFHTPVEKYKLVRLMRAARYAGSQVGGWIRLSDCTSITVKRLIHEHIWSHALALMQYLLNANTGWGGQISPRMS